MRILANKVQENKCDFRCNRNDVDRKVPFEISRSSAFSTSTSVSTFSPVLPVKRYSWMRLSFGKFTFQPIKLSVLKLDGSSFDIIVVKKATVAKLKQAVEAAFSLWPREGDETISWSHVWGQFCLSFEGQKLLRDRDSIVRYGIRNGDELQFVRYMPVNNLATERSEKLTNGSAESMKRKGWRNHQNLVPNEVNEGYVDFGANTKCGSKWVGTMRGLFLNPRVAKGNDCVVKSTVRLGRSFSHDDDEDDDTRRDLSCRWNAGSIDSSYSFNGLAGGFGYPTGYCLK